VGEEELFPLVDQERVKIGGQLRAVGEAKFFSDRREDLREYGFLPLGSD